MAKGTETASTSSNTNTAMGTAVSGVKLAIEKKLTQFQDALKKGDLSVTSQATSAKNDLANISRIVDRVNKGFYN